MALQYQTDIFLVGFGFVSLLPLKYNI